MKKNIAVIAFCIFGCCSFAQTSSSNSILVRHDTTLLKAEDCKWLIKSMLKNDPAFTSEIGKPVPLLILEAIEKGKLKAIDIQTNNPIPAKEIFTWKKGVDTLPLYDNEGNITKYQVIKHLHTGDNFRQIRILHDWYFDVSSGKFHAIIKWIELMENIVTSQGIFIGMAPICRIYY